MEEFYYGQARPAFYLFIFGRNRGGKRKEGNQTEKKLSPSPQSPKRAYVGEREIRKTLAFERKGKLQKATTKEQNGTKRSPMMQKRGKKRRSWCVQAGGSKFSLQHCYLNADLKKVREGK